MMYINKETGVILKPYSSEAEKALQKDSRYAEKLEDKPSRRSGGRKSTTQGTEE